MQPFALYGEMAKDLVVTRESNLTCIIHQSVSVRVNKSVLNKYVHNLHSMEAEE